MKGIYITSQDMKDRASGVNKKIDMQIVAFNKMGIELEIPDLSAQGNLDKIVRRLPFIRSGFEIKLNALIKSVDKWDEVDFVYIRHPMVSIQFLSMVKRIKQKGICVIYEFPTFPYDKNSDKLSARLSLAKDKFSRGRLHKWVDKGVNFSGFNEIFQIPCFSLANGIDIDRISPRNIKNNDSKVIRFIGVALLTKWNGYDRLINAIHKYSTECDEVIEFHIVGKGDIFDELQNLVKKLHLEERVVLHGPLYGKDLDSLYDICDIGVGTLNPSRKYKNHIMSSLKTKEYAAKGMPFIKGDIDAVFDKKYPDFVFDVSDDESELNLKAIINWYRALEDKYGKDGLVKEIRNFASEELTWEKQLRPVATYIEEKCKR